MHFAIGFSTEMWDVRFQSRLVVFVRSEDLLFVLEFLTDVSIVFLGLLVTGCGFLLLLVLVSERYQVKCISAVMGLLSPECLVPSPALPVNSLSVSHGPDQGLPAGKLPSGLWVEREEGREQSGVEEHCPVRRSDSLDITELILTVSFFFFSFS